MSFQIRGTHVGADLGHTSASLEDFITKKTRISIQRLLSCWIWLSGLCPFIINKIWNFNLVNSRQASFDEWSARRKTTTYTGQHTNTDIHVTTVTRTHDLRVWAGEDISCLRQSGQRDRTSVHCLLQAIVMCNVENMSKIKRVKLSL
jgi:hypothetical protein